MRFVSFCQERNIRPLIDVQLEPLEDFRRTRKIGLSTWQTERQILITFFNYCEHHGWIITNPAKRLKARAISNRTRWSPIRFRKRRRSWRRVIRSAGGNTTRAERITINAGLAG